MFGLIKALFFPHRVRREVVYVPPEPDGDPFDFRLKPADGTRHWVRIYVCPHCLAETDHEEFMTKICLSCGAEMQNHPLSAAIRAIKIDGSWTDQMRLQGKNYLRDGDGWKEIKKETKP